MDYAWDPTCLLNALKILNFPKITHSVKISRYAFSEAKKTTFWVMNEMKIPNFTKVMQCNKF